MRTLEDRLTQASDEARLQVDQIDTRTATSIGSRQQRRRALVGTVAVAAMIIVFGTTALVMSDGPGQDAATELATPPTTAKPVEESVASTPTPLPTSTVGDITHLVGSITASSELSTAFGAAMLIDGDLERGWQDASLRGVGAEIVLEFTEPVAITEIVVHPYKDEGRFARNYWVETYEIRTNDLAVVITGKFANVPETQVVRLGTNETFLLTFTVTTTYPALPHGDDPPYDELAIAEIQVFGTSFGGIVVDDALAATTTTSTWPVSDDTDAFMDLFVSPDIDLPEGTDHWGTLIDTARSGDVPVDLAGQLVAVYDAAIAERGGLPILYSSDIYEPGVYQGATFLLNAGGSDVLVNVYWLEWDDRSEENPMGFPAGSLQEQWGGDNVLVNISSELGEFGAMNAGSLKKVTFFVPTTHEEGNQPLPITESEMRAIAQAAFEVLTP